MAVPAGVMGLGVQGPSETGFEGQGLAEAGFGMQGPNRAGFRGTQAPNKADLGTDTP